MLKTLLRRLAVAVAVPAMAGGLLIAGGSPAAAVDGRVPDSRSTTPKGEITAYYWHGLNRDPDTGGLNNFMSFADKDCRWGVLDAGVKILDSAEARNAWGNNPTTLAGMLYASLLNRAPDAGGLNTFRRHIETRGLRSAITEMQSSQEFRNRVNKLCAGRASSNATVYNHQEALKHAQTVHSTIYGLSISCGLNALATYSTKVSKAKKAKDIAKAIKTAKKRADTILGSVDSACNGALAMYRATDKIRTVADVESNNPRPVFIYQNTRSFWRWSGKYCETTLRIGPNATSWNGYSTTYRCI